MTSPTLASPGKPRTALIGISGYGSIYLALARAARDRGELQLRAAVIINPAEEQANEAELIAHGCKIYRDYESMLRAERGNVDLCLIPTGIQWHARMTIAALEAGAHVLVEKPLAGCLADALAIRAAEQRTGRWVAVGFQDLYCSVNLGIKDAIQQGVIGRVESVRFLGIWPRPNTYFSRNHWAGRLHADGVPVRDSLLNNAFAHFVNLGLFFAGPGIRSSATVDVDSVELYRAHAIETFDTSVVRGKTREGTSFWVGASHTSERTLEPIITLTGSAGTIVWRHGNVCTIRSKAGVEERRIPDIEVARQRMFALVLQRLRENGSWICDTKLAQAHTDFIETVHAANEPVNIPSTAVRWTADANERRWITVPGLTEALEQAFGSGSTLAAAGFSVPLHLPTR